MTDANRPIPPGQPAALAIPIPTAATREWLVSRIAEIIGVDLDRIDPDADVTDFDLDSTEVLILVAELEGRLGVRIDAGLLWTARSLSALGTYADSVAAARRAEPRRRLAAVAAPLAA